MTGWTEGWTSAAPLMEPLRVLRPDVWLRLFTGLAGSLLIAGAAYRKRALTASGVRAAVFVGTALYTLGSAVWFGTLIAFFVSSTLLSKWKKRMKETAEAGYEKSGRRDAGQVLANGLAGTLFCAFHAVWPHPLWLAAFIGVMAAVTADTWATEVGGLSRKPPRSILTFAPVPAGTSGGVTALGTAASFCGSLFIGAAAALLLALTGTGTQLLPAVGPAPSASALVWPLLAAAVAGGMIGSLADSLLGATVQRMYRCERCGRIVERPVHCGQPARFTRGLPFMNNDAVNAVSSLIGAAAAASVWLLVWPG